MDTGNSGTCGDVGPVSAASAEAEVDVATGDDRATRAAGQNDSQVTAHVDIAIELCDLDFPEVAPNIDVAVEDAAKSDNASEVPRHRDSAVDVVGVGSKTVIRWRRDDTVNRDTADRLGRNVTKIDQAGHRVVALGVGAIVGGGHRVNPIDPAGLAGGEDDAADNVGGRKVDVCHHRGTDAEVAKTSGNRGRSACVRGLRVGNDRADVGVTRAP